MNASNVMGGAFKAVVPEGAFVYPIKCLKPTRWFSFLLLPEFTLLAFSSAVDPLRIANQLAQKPLYGWHIVSENGQAVRSSSGIDVAVQGELAEIPASHRLFVCSGNNGNRVATSRVLSGIRRHVRFGGPVGGICTGAATLARAGLLAGRRFTLHWENQPGFIEAFPDLKPSRSRVEVDAGLLTCCGGSASTEMMLQIIKEDYGADFAIAVSDMCLNSQAPSLDREQRSSIGRVVDSRNPKILRVLREMHANVEDPLPLEELSKTAGLSRRQMERLFLNILGEGPATAYRNIRLDQAHSLFVETDMSVAEVAVATGFGSAAHLARLFKRRFGVTPYGKRGPVSRQP